MEAETQRLYKELEHVSMYPGKKWTIEDCAKIAPYTSEINKLKKETDTYILAHSYVPPEVVYGVSDFGGDSFALSQHASTVKSKNIIFAGVWFMAETAKIMNPSKRVLIPAGHAGCTLADSLNGPDLRAFKAEHKGAKVVCYINSSAEVKAESDVCVTSSNVYDIVAKIDSDKIIFVPDMFMADNVRAEMKRRGIKKEILSTGGSCCVHDQYMPFHVTALRQQAENIKILAHPECNIDVCRMADYVGSTSGMAKYVSESSDKNFGLLTEYGLVNKLEHDNPAKSFFWSFGTCAFMKRNTLINTLTALKEPNAMQVVEVDPAVAAKAKKCVEMMFEMTK
ncbi:quinolinate synthase [Parelusimicrobium proximum]|uniref:quinolinate synthase NadA n=1 Tax=Parelusimicrobium proximum TaxID=3228953 RepID=UPI003D17083A